MPSRYFRQAFAALEANHEVEYLQIEDKTFMPTTPSELRIKEWLGVPSDLYPHMAGVEALVVQGAPVTDAVLDASAVLQFVGCARGGPVNVDVEAVSARGLPLVNSPGKNAEAVADQTLAFLIMVARGFPRAQRFLDEGHQLKDNWDGAQFTGSDLRRHTLGLVGYGLVGHQVAHRALAFGMSVVVYDPFVVIDPSEAIAQVATLDELAFLDVVDVAVFVDEDALDAALESGHLAGAALDVVRQSAEICRHKLLRHPNVVMTPHIGGATHETLLQGAEMIADEIRRFCSGQPLCYLVNRKALGL